MASFKVWIKSGCSFCIKAQALLLEKQLPHEIIVLDKQDDLLYHLQQKYKWKTVPIIVKENNETETFVGGYTDLLEHLKGDSL